MGTPPLAEPPRLVMPKRRDFWSQNASCREESLSGFRNQMEPGTSNGCASEAHWNMWALPMLRIGRSSTHLIKHGTGKSLDYMELCTWDNHLSMVDLLTSHVRLPQWTAAFGCLRVPPKSDSFNFGSKTHILHE